MMIKTFLPSLNLKHQVKRTSQTWGASILYLIKVKNLSSFYVYLQYLRQTSVSSCEFLRTKHEQIKTIQTEVINSKR